MAVCGDPKLRHGIILAKNELAKKYGIYTPETVYSALKKCPKLVLVQGNYQDYQKYSKLVNAIYLKYTDKVEPFGIDESFLDVTESISLFGDGKTIANLIREEVKNTLGLTISVGVSFNKSLAKLGSDLKKPDAVTVLDYESFKKKIYPLPVNSLLFVGKSTYQALMQLHIKTIGDLANYNKSKLVKKLGKIGATIHEYANGLDFESVLPFESEKIPKSVSKGNTFSEDITHIENLEPHVCTLCYEVAESLRKYHLKCTSVGIQIKDSHFMVINRQRKIKATYLYQDIERVAMSLLQENYIPNTPIRAITVSVQQLVGKEEIEQIDLFEWLKKKEDNEMQSKEKRMENVSNIIDEINQKVGGSITFGSMIK